MRCLIAVLAIVLVSIPPASDANAQAGCTFKLGFKALHDAIPDVVGDCTEDEHFEVSTGNSLQATTAGLMVWRKGDNRTVFTDGATTWLNGPYGVQSRPNDGLPFAWEGVGTVQAAPPAPDSRPVPPPPAAAPSASAPVTRFSVLDATSYRTKTGTTSIQGFVVNNGPTNADGVDITVSLIDAAGRTVGSASTTPVPDFLRPGERGVWKASITGTPDFQSIDYQTRSDPESTSISALGSQELGIDGVSARWAGAGNYQAYTINGQITNRSSATTWLTKVAVAGYNAAGQLVDVATTTTKLMYLTTGQRSPFEAAFPVERKDIVKYDVFAGSTCLGGRC